MIKRLHKYLCDVIIFSSYCNGLCPYYITCSCLYTCNVQFTTCRIFTFSQTQSVKAKYMQVHHYKLTQVKSLKVSQVHADLFFPTCEQTTTSSQGIKHVFWKELTEQFMQWTWISTQNNFQNIYRKSQALRFIEEQKPGKRSR